MYFCINILIIYYVVVYHVIVLIFDNVFYFISFKFIRYLCINKGQLLNYALYVVVFHCILKCRLYGIIKVNCLDIFSYIMTI